MNCAASAPGSDHVARHAVAGVAVRRLDRPHRGLFSGALNVAGEVNDGAALASVEPLPGGSDQGPVLGVRRPHLHLVLGVLRQPGDRRASTP